MKREGNGECIDDLKYQYSGDQLLKVMDLSVNNSDFARSSSMEVGYKYDVNGNMITDFSKGICSIKYNVLNLPQTINVEGNEIKYIYSATGEKLQNIVRGKTMTYCGSFVYEDGNLRYILNSEGRYVVNGERGYNEYNITDHLGNVRAVLDEAGNVKQKNNYYPFGKRFDIYSTSTNKYYYNGKELQEGTDWLDYGWRMYDAAIGRWQCVDNKAELYFGRSPYIYALNTPINAIDPDGEIVIFVNGMHIGFNGAKSSYWRSNDYQCSILDCFDLRVKLHFKDKKSEYYDGANGGILGFPNNLNPFNRMIKGYLEGEKQAKRIIENLARTDEGVITESIKVITHSMGAAYGRGFIAALVKFAKDNPELCEGLSISEYDFAAYQQNYLKAIRGVSLFQYDNIKDWVVGILLSKHKRQEGAEEYKSDVNSSGGHSIKDFIDVINQLKPGIYEFKNGSFVKVN